MRAESEFAVECKTRNGKIVNELKGQLDETSDFRLVKHQGGVLVLNFEKVTFISSRGIRNWVVFLKMLGQVKVIYEACPPCIVRAFNLVPIFREDVEILSIFVPYTCDQCETEELLLCPAPKEQAEVRSLVVKKFPCKSCKKGEMKFLELSEEYFTFCSPKFSRPLARRM